MQTNPFRYRKKGDKAHQEARQKPTGEKAELLSKDASTEPGSQSLKYGTT
jgi:hypothetical protein